ncbi:MAG: glycogen-binding domain-containing protein [Gemmatimonadaceae bacterium]
MSLRFIALAKKRAFVVGICCLIPAAPCAAQFRMAWDANAAVSQIDATQLVSRSTVATQSVNSNTSKWLGLNALGTTLRYDRSFGQVRADGLIRGGDLATQAAGGLNALLATPVWKGFRLLGSIDARRSSFDQRASSSSIDDTSFALKAAIKSVPSWQTTTSTKISYAYDRNGWWIGADTRRGAAVGDSTSRTKLVAGYSRQIGNLALGLSVGSQTARFGGRSAGFRDSTFDRTVFDSVLKKNVTFLDSIKVRYNAVASLLQRWSEFGGHVGWASGHFAFDGALNARPQIGGLRSTVWGDAVGSAAVTSRLAFVAAMRTTPVVPGLALSGSRTFSLGLRVAPPSLWRPDAPTPTRSVVSAFHVQQTAPGEYIITMRLPSARSVELAGDFTGWKAVTLHQIDNIRWEVAIHATTGSHRCNIRIDGAEWVPPPRVTTMEDEFNGRVGLIVIE